MFALRWLIDYSYYCSESGFCTFVIARGAAALSRLLNPERITGVESELRDRLVDGEGKI